MINRTVVGWDGSEEARAALDWAVRREAARGGTIDIVRVIDNTTVSADYAVTEALFSKEHSATGQEGERLFRLHPSLTVNVHVTVGDPCEEMLRFAAPDTLLVVGTQQRQGIRSRYRWSLGARLAAQCRYLVAVIPPLGDVSRHGIVAGFDGSEPSHRAVEVAAFEAEAAGERLSILHAWQEPMVDQRFLADDEFIVSLARRHHDLLEDEVEAIRRRHPRIEVDSSLVRKDPAHSLLDSGRTASLLVTGHRRLGGANHILLGSVSHSVILGLDAPAMIVGWDTPGFDAVSASETGSIRVAM